MPVNINRIAFMIGERIREYALSEVPVGQYAGGGQLRKTLITTPIGEGEVTVGSPEVYARAVHDGRRAMTIRPNVSKNPPRGDRKSKDPKKARLKFRIGGVDVFATKANLPAMPPNPFLLRAVRRVQQEGFGFVYNAILPEVNREIADNIVAGIKINITI